MKLILLTTLIAVSESATVASNATAAPTDAAPTDAVVTPAANAPVCTQAEKSSYTTNKYVYTWQPLEIDCPAAGGAPANVIVSFNMGGTGSGLEAVHYSVAASSKSGGFVGIAANAGSSKSTDTTPIEGASQSNMLCYGDLNGSGKLCDSTSYNSNAGANVVVYFSIWNTGDCEGKIIVEATIEEFDENQGASCAGSLALLGAPRSGNPDDLYCNVGSASSCDSSFDEIFCGSIAAGYQCVAETTVTSLTLFGFTSTCTTNALSCKTSDFSCPAVSDADSDCQVCNANDCFGDDVLAPVDGGGIITLATSIVVVSAAMLF